MFLECRKIFLNSSNVLQILLMCLTKNVLGNPKKCSLIEIMFSEVDFFPNSNNDPRILKNVHELKQMFLNLNNVLMLVIEEIFLNSNNILGIQKKSWIQMMLLGFGKIFVTKKVLAYPKLFFNWNNVLGSQKIVPLFLAF